MTAWRHRQGPRSRSWHNMSMRLVCIAVCLAGPTALAAAPSDAQARPTIDEIVTTARRREERLQDIPVAATTFSREDLDRYGLASLEQISSDTPHLVISRGVSGAGPTLWMRGVGTSGGSAGFDPAVGIVIDGVSYARGRWVQQGYFDLEAAEVLKGPQALYFGKNNSAGLISLRTANPGDSFEAYVLAGYETEAQETVIEGMVSVPITDTFGARLALRQSDMSGFMKNSAQPQVGVDPLGYVIPGGLNSRLPNERDQLGRLTLRWQPDERLEVIGKANWARNRDSSRYSTLQQVRCFGPGGQPQPIFGVPDPFDDCTRNFTQAMSDIPDEMIAGEPHPISKRGGEQWSEYDARSFSLDISYQLDHVSLNSITSLIKYDNAYMGNSSFDSAGQIVVFEDEGYEAFSQEVRMVTSFDQPLNFMAGFFYQDLRFDFRNSPRIAPVPPDALTGRQFSWDKTSRADGQTWSVFGEAVWEITDHVELAAGVRYTEEKNDSSLSMDYIHSALAGVFTSQPFEFGFKDTNVSPQVTLTWRPRNDLTTFVAYREGFKSGGFDHSFIPTRADATIDDLTFESETASGFEIGAKGTLFDRQLRYAVTVYRYTFDDLQVFALDNETTTFFVDNAAKARTTGFELDFDWLATSQLSVRGALGFNKGEYSEFLAQCWSGQSFEAGCDQEADPITGRGNLTDRSGKPLPRAPEWNARLGMLYSQPLMEGWTAMLGVDGSYSSSFLLDERGTPDTVQSGYFRLDANARIISSDERWELAFIGRNLTNKAIAHVGFGRPLTGGASGLPEGSPGQIRSDVTIGVERGRSVMARLAYRI